MIVTIIFSIIALLLIGFMIYTVITQDEQPRNIAVYSGSFNPIHIGHKTIINTLSKKFDWVYLIVTPQNPLKDKIETSPEDRSEAAYKAVIKNGFYNVSVNNIENEMLPPYYTINTLKELSKRNENGIFTLAIGADNLTNIREWKDYDIILKEYGVIVFPRGAEDIQYLEALKDEFLLEDKNYKIEIEHTITPSISSTEIRNAIEKGDNVEHLLM